MSKLELMTGLKSSGYWNRFTNVYWWQKAFDEYNLATGSKLRPTCGMCFKKVKEWLEVIKVTMGFGKRILSKKYKHVAEWNPRLASVTIWQINIRGVNAKGFNSEREAALAVDKYLISKGKEPVNILVRK